MPRAKCVIIPANLIRFRSVAGFTQDDLATKAGIERRTVQRAEAGLGITASTLRRLADALNVDARKLLQADETEFRVAALRRFNKLIDVVRVNSDAFLEHLVTLRNTNVVADSTFGIVAMEAARKCRVDIDRESNCGEVALELRMAFWPLYSTQEWGDFFAGAQESLASFQTLAIDVAKCSSDPREDEKVVRARLDTIKKLVSRRDELITMVNRGESDQLTELEQRARM